MTEAALLHDYATRKDAEAFAALVKRYQRLIFATCRRVLHEPQDVDDAVQETLLHLAQKAGHVHSNIGAWLHQCAVSVSIDLNRRRSTRRKRESVAAAKRAELASDDAQRMLAELREHLDVALAKIDNDQRELIVQRYFVERSQVDLAAELGIAASTLSHRLDRAIEALRVQLAASKSMLLASASAATLATLLKAEQASAAVPMALTANLMKIGLTGVTVAGGATGAASVGMFAALTGKFLVAAVGAILIGVGRSLWDGARTHCVFCVSLRPFATSIRRGRRVSPDPSP